MNNRLLRPPAEAIAEWLLTAAPDIDTARLEWETDGLTLLRCGNIFDAIRIPLDEVEAVAGTRSPADVDDYLARALHGAPVIRCGIGRHLYVLCEPGTAQDCKAPGTEPLGDILLGVPRIDLASHPGHTASYWAVPPASPAALGRGNAVAGLVVHGRFELASEIHNPEHRRRRTERIDEAAARRLLTEVLDLTGTLPHTVPTRARIDPAAAELRVYVEDLVCAVEVLIKDEDDSSDRETAQWLIGRARKTLAAKAPATDQEAAVWAEDLALTCRVLLEVHQWRTSPGGEGSGE